MLVYEHEIRKKLSKNLIILGQDLTLVKEEYYLENPYGAKGYIDILAIDTMGNYVIIEIKRSNQAARQALHELNKYPMLLRNKIGVKESQIRLIIVSTDWHELLVPYSEHFKTCVYQLEGYKIKITDKGDIINKELIKPLENFQDKKTSKRHLAFFYYTKEQALMHINNICESIETCGINDYMVSLIIFKRQVTVYPYCVYVSFQRYNVEFYKELLIKNIEKENSDEDYKLEKIEDIYHKEELENEDEFLDYLEDNIQYYIVNKVECEDVEISYPEKIATNLKVEDEIIYIKRSGRYKEDIRFKDKRFYLKEIMSFSDDNAFYFHSICTYKSKAQLNELKEKLNEFLSGNKNWYKQILSAINKFENKKFNLSIEIFNPLNLFESFYSFYKFKEGIYLPHYLLFIEDSDENILYLFKGVLTWDGITNQDFKKLIRKYYYGDFMQMFIKRYDVNIYHNITKDLGLSFQTDVTIFRAGEKEDYSYVFDNLDFEYIKDPKRKYITHFFNEHSGFLEESYNFIDKSTVTYSIK